MGLKEQSVEAAGGLGSWELRDLRIHVYLYIYIDLCMCICIFLCIHTYIHAYIYNEI